MAKRRREDGEGGEGESYYASMTDMMVGVVFIFIIMLGYFASQFHADTERLTRADDPKTAALLRSAPNLQASVQPVRIDYEQKVVCLTAQALRVQPKPGAEALGERCFSYAEPKPTETEVKVASKRESRSALLRIVASQTGAPSGAVTAKPGEGSLSFDADQLFVPGSDQLSAQGQAVAGQVAQTLARLLPCYGFLEGYDMRSCSNGPNRVSVVNVLAATDLDPFSAEGQAASALALRRSVAFYKALTSAQPTLAALRNRAPQPGVDSQPLLRVASIAQSEEASAQTGFGTTISIQLDMFW